MNDTQLLSAMQNPEAYPHRVNSVKLVETHMSWVFLTGEYAYKVKKSVRFDFVDFSTLELRQHFCEEEIRCNRAFAPELYLDVVPIVITDDGTIKVSVPGRVIEWAVSMLQFQPGCEADVLLERGELDVSEMRAFGKSLALRHERLEPILTDVDQTRCVLDNFETLGRLLGGRDKDRLTSLENAARREVGNYEAFFSTRHSGGRVRECHGDLHLSNLVRTEEGLTAFDCLEFDAALRTIDVYSDVAFLFMDCACRGAEHLAYAFVDGYLDASGDYAGVRLLPFWARYRSIVRAKVAALRLAQPHLDRESKQVNQAKFDRHLQWALDQYRRRGLLILTCGLSGSGKSHWAQHLVSAIGAIRLRSDVYRKSSQGLAPTATSSSAVGGGIYTQDKSETVYRDLAGVAEQLLQEAETVIVDAAHLRADQREILYAAARASDTPAMVLYFQAPERVLRHRIEQRQGDASEADHAVLTWQQATIEPPGVDEPVYVIDTQQISIDQLAALVVDKRGG